MFNEAQERAWIAKIKATVWESFTLPAEFNRLYGTPRYPTAQLDWYPPLRQQKTS